MSDDPKCGFCGFPVVNRLLKDRIDDLRNRNEELEEALDKTTQVVEEYLLAERTAVPEITHELAARVDELLGIMDDPVSMGYDGASTRSAARNALAEYREIAAAPQPQEGESDE